jgi:hypothetical protein
MILRAHLSGSQSYDVGDEIWQEPLADVIRAEAEMIASYAGAELLGTGTRDSVRERIIAEMTVALVSDGDTYQAPDKIRDSSSFGGDFGASGAVWSLI